MAEDTSRISMTAHYTGYVWYKHGLSSEEFVTHFGRLAYYGLLPGDKFSKYVVGHDLETLLLQRHRIIDCLLDQAIQRYGEIQVLELACGLSPRGYRYCGRYGEDQLSYVEADLPAMATRKQNLLKTLPTAYPHHRVVPCNILETEGDLALNNIINKHFNKGKPLYVITEGLVNYFPTSVIEPFWQCLANSFNDFDVAVYLTDFVHVDEMFEHAAWLNAGMQLLSVAARGKTGLHYSGKGNIERGFGILGFKQTIVHNPEDYYQQLPIPRSKGRPTIRVVENCVKVSK